MIKAVIFDMFETLVTHYNSPVYMGKEIACDMGIPETKFREIWDTSDNDRTLGKQTLEVVIEEALRVNGCYSDGLFECIIAKRKSSKRECFHHLHPEILPMLETLRKRNLKIGLITNCYYEESDVIRASILYPYFDSVCMSCEMGIKKPDRAIFQRSLQELDVMPGECVYVGDGGSQELEMAQAAGMHPVQAVWYLKEGVRQPAQRKPGFVQAQSPLEVISKINKQDFLLL